MMNIQLPSWNFSSKKIQNIFIVLTCCIVGFLWIRPLLFNLGSEIIDGRMEIALSQTTASSVSEIIDLIKHDVTLEPYFLLLFLSFINLKGKIIIYYTLIAILGAWGSFRYFFAFSRNARISSILTLCYTCSLPLAVFFSSKYGIFSHLYAVVPLFGYLLYRVLSETRTFYRDAILLFILSLFINPYNLSVYIAVGIFGFWSGAILLIHEKVRVKMNLRRYVFFALLLILPLFHMNYQLQTFSRLGPVQMATIQSESYEMTNKQSSYLNTSLLKGIWDFSVMWPGNHKAYDFQDLYGNKVLNSLFFLSLSILTILILQNIVGNESRIPKLLGLTIIFLLPMIVGAKEGLFSDLYINLYERFTPFQIFRQGYKWVPILVLIICTAFAYIFALLKSQIQRVLLTLAIVIFTLYNIMPFVFGQQIKPATMFHIPDDYSLMKKHISKESTLLLLPEQYHAGYTWGSPGGPIELIFSPYLIHAKPQPKYSVENVRYFTIIENILNEEFETIRGNSDYDSILVRKDFSYKTNTGLIHDPLVFREILERNEFTKVLETENLILYRTK